MLQEVFEKLQNLQDVLLQKYDIVNEINDIPKALVVKNELLARLKKQFIDKSGLLEKKQEKVKSMKDKLKEAETLREKYEKDMDIIKTQREYELLDKAIKETTEKEQQFRKDILKEEKEIEELNQFIEREHQIITQQEEELKTEELRIESESEEKKSILAKLEEEERIIIPGLDDDILFKFERIIKNKSGLGIVPVKGSVCTGCHMILPAQFVNDVRTGDEVLFCPYCSRILFYVEADKDTFLSFKDSDIGGFSDYDFDDDEEFEDEDFADNTNSDVISKREPLRGHDDEEYDEDDEEELFEEEEPEIFEEEPEKFEAEEEFEKEAEEEEEFEEGEFEEEETEPEAEEEDVDIEDEEIEMDDEDLEKDDEYIEDEEE